MPTYVGIMIYEDINSIKGSLVSGGTQYYIILLSMRSTNGQT